MNKVKQAGSDAELQAIIALRYKILRQPWGKPLDTAADELESSSINAFIADASGRVLACGRLQENEGHTGQIRYMAVDDACQGQGLGKLIVEFLEEKGKAMGLTKIELQARENAVEFYKRCGYVITKETFKLWDIIQHYLMEKALR